MFIYYIFFGSGLMQNKEVKEWQISGCKSKERDSDILTKAGSDLWHRMLNNNCFRAKMIRKQRMHKLENINDLKNFYVDYILYSFGCKTNLTYYEDKPVTFYDADLVKGKNKICLTKYDLRTYSHDTVNLKLTDKLLLSPILSCNITLLHFNTFPSLSYDESTNKINFFTYLDSEDLFYYNYPELDNEFVESKYNITSEDTCDDSIVLQDTKRKESYKKEDLEKDAEMLNPAKIKHLIRFDAMKTHEEIIDSMLDRTEEQRSGYNDTKISSGIKNEENDNREVNDDKVMYVTMATLPETKNNKLRSTATHDNTKSRDTMAALLDTKNNELRSTATHETEDALRSVPTTHHILLAKKEKIDYDQTLFTISNKYATSEKTNSKLTTDRNSDKSTENPMQKKAKISDRTNYGQRTDTKKGTLNMQPSLVTKYNVKGIQNEVEGQQASSSIPISYFVFFFGFLFLLCCVVLGYFLVQKHWLKKKRRQEEDMLLNITF